MTIFFFSTKKNPAQIPYSSGHLQPTSASSELPHKPAEKQQHMNVFFRFTKMHELCRNFLVSNLFVSPLGYVTGLVFVFLLHSLSKRIPLFDVLLSLSLFLLPLFLLLLTFLVRLVVHLAWITPDVWKTKALNHSFCTAFNSFINSSKDTWMVKILLTKQLRSGRHMLTYLIFSHTRT